MKSFLDLDKTFAGQPRQVSVLLREARIAPGRRSQWPVVGDADASIVWVPGICRSDARIPTEGTEALCVHVAHA